jgi:hypothetical protein
MTVLLNTRRIYAYTSNKYFIYETKYNMGMHVNLISRSTVTVKKGCVSIFFV